MNGHPYSLAARVVLGVAAVTIAACGGASPPSAEAPAATYAPAMAGPGPATTANDDEALAVLDRAEAELESALGRTASTPSLTAPSGGAAPAPTSARPQSAPPSTPQSTTTEAAPKKSGDATAGAPADPCDIACRALASMDRAAAHLCDLAGEPDPRCDGAKTRVKSASERVVAQCPRCAPR